MVQLIFLSLPHLVIQVKAALLREEVHRIQVRVHHGHQLAQGQGFELAHGKQAVVQLGAKAPSEGNLGVEGKRLKISFLDNCTASTTKIKYMSTVVKFIQHHETVQV